MIEEVGERSLTTISCLSERVIEGDEFEDFIEVDPRLSSHVSEAGRGTTRFGESDTGSPWCEDGGEAARAARMWAGARLVVAKG